MQRGSITKRCQCRDGQGRRVKSCRKEHGSWSFRVDAGRDPTTGVRRQITRSGFRTRAEAVSAMTELITQLNQGAWVDDESMTVAEWLEAWLAEIAERRAVKTMADYRGHVRDAWLPQLGHLKLRDLRRHHIERVLSDLGKPVVVPPAAGNVGRRVRRRSATTITSRS
jgi:hypothetical protein